MVVRRGSEASGFSSPRFLVWEIDNDLLNWDGLIQEKELVATLGRWGFGAISSPHVAGPIMSYI